MEEILKAKILIVEDESIIAHDLMNSLVARGLTITQMVSTASEAIISAKANPPDLVLMDILLEGDMDGIEAAYEINRSLDVPIIFLTAHSDSSTLKKTEKTAPYGYLIKPCEEK